MRADATHAAILKDVAAFSKIKRYRGMLPTRLVMYQDQIKIDELLEAGFIERLNVSMPCGSEHTLLKLTDAGSEAVKVLDRPDADSPAKQELVSQEPEACRVLENLNEEQMDILNDVFHYSKIKRFGGMMHYDELSIYDVKNVNILFARGFVIRVKADLGSGKKRKGLILSEKGLYYLGVSY